MQRPGRAAVPYPPAPDYLQTTFDLRRPANSLGKLLGVMHRDSLWKNRLEGQRAGRPLLNVGLSSRFPKRKFLDHLRPIVTPIFTTSPVHLVKNPKHKYGSSQHILNDSELVHETDSKRPTFDIRMSSVATHPAQRPLSAGTGVISQTLSSRAKFFV
ncbi:hypothetical protein EVAR_92472_1 [Eumeta japonica]|uniref:Uncharacterized protein n=1 Tax=Eumeta variegata TaxID=151549 RepID=A0A4C1T6V8_EUMVA|nr:hypothetical protein EVAR_92472_1 [Eumeta japonica]